MAEAQDKKKKETKAEKEERMTKEKQEALEIAMQPVREWFAEYGTPYTIALLSYGSVMVYEGSLGVVFEDKN